MDGVMPSGQLLVKTKQNGDKIHYYTRVTTHCFRSRERLSNVIKLVFNKTFFLSYFCFSCLTFQSANCHLPSFFPLIIALIIAIISHRKMRREKERERSDYPSKSAQTFSSSSFHKRNHFPTQESMREKFWIDAKKGKRFSTYSTSKKFTQERREEKILAKSLLLQHNSTVYHTAAASI